MIVTVDRIEGDLAVLIVDGTQVDWPVASLPPGAKEGSRYTVTFADAPSDLSEAEARLARLKAKTPQSGDIDL